MKILNMLTDDEISEDQALNNVIYDKMKTQLAKEFSGKTIVIAEGKFLGSSLRILSTDVHKIEHGSPRMARAIRVGDVNRRNG